MDLPSPVEAVHRRGAETRVAMHVTGLTSARNCSAVLSVHDTDSHGSGTGGPGPRRVRPAEAAFRAHLGKPGGTFDKYKISDKWVE